MPQTIRTFLAIELSESVRDWLAALQRHLRAAPSGRDVRWVDLELMHITLKFFGDTELSKAAIMKTIVEKVASSRPSFTLAATGVGCFPNAHRPRVVWAGLEPSRDLAELQAALESACEEAGFPKESRPFAPHLTLGRVRDSLSIEQLRRVGEDLAKVPNQRERVVWTVDAISFFRSDLKPTGPVYTVIQNSKLGRNHTSETPVRT